MASLSPSLMRISFAAWPGVTGLGVGVMGSPEESAFLYEIGRRRGGARVFYVGDCFLDRFYIRC